MWTARFLPVVCAIASGCAILSGEDPQRITLPDVAKFSSGQPGEEFPDGWRLWSMSRFKKPTDYRMVKFEGRTVVRASAESSASGLVHEVDIDPKTFPILRWRWRVSALISEADNSHHRKEDSPARLVVTFAGDKSKWGFSDRLLANQMRMIAGHDLPYATLMYIWGNRAAKDTVIHNPHTGRIRMVVVQSGRENVGQWCEESRNLYEDYRRAFGEEPPRITTIAIMTDTDNTETSTQAHYGDIAFQRSPQ